MLIVIMLIYVAIELCTV